MPQESKDPNHNVGNSTDECPVRQTNQGVEGNRKKAVTE